MCFIGLQPLEFSSHFDVQLAFEQLTRYFIMLLPMDSIEQCKEYCREHWNDENLNSSLSSISFIVPLFDALKSSPFYNFLNTKLLMHLAASSETEPLVASVINYENYFKNAKLRDIPCIKEIKVTGEIIPEQDYLLVSSAILEHGVTIGQLQEMCTPRYLQLCNTVILDFGRNLPSFYRSVQVNGSVQF